jgi:hypothetical protein
MYRNQRSERAMANKRILRRGLYLLAGVLAAPAMLVGFAAEAHARHHHAAHVVHFAPPNAKVPVSNLDAANGTRQTQDRKAAKSDGVPPNTLTGTAVGKGGKQPSGVSTEPATGAPAKDADAPDFHTKNLGPIDTRIMVQPRVHSVGPGTARQTKGKVGSIGSRYSRVQHAFAPGKAGHVTRNAIGLPITPQSTIPASSTALIRSPTNASPGMAPSGGDGLVKPNPSPDHFAVSHPGSVVTGTGAGRLELNGSSFPRRGFVPATLGGPTKSVVVGINGSTIRPKH